MLTLNGGGGKSDEIRERIEAKLQHLYNSVSEKAVRISELVQRLDKLQDDNNKLKIELTSPRPALTSACASASSARA